VIDLYLSIESLFIKASLGLNKFSELMIVKSLYVPVTSGGLDRQEPME
jgi:hypothetical protein